MASGGGSFSAGLDGNIQGYDNGSLTVSNFSHCVAEGCSIGAQFNLVGMKYIQTGTNANLVFVDVDSRSLLLSQASYDPYTNNMSGQMYQQQFNVQPVPLPAGFLLLASGLMGLGTLAKKKSLRR